MSHNKEIILTGGDADEFAKIFPSAKVDKKLIFIGMNTILKKADIC
jgi:pantothenate kinase type III